MAEKLYLRARNYGNGPDETDDSVAVEAQLNLEKLYLAQMILAGGKDLTRAWRDKLVAIVGEDTCNSRIHMVDTLLQRLANATPHARRSKTAIIDRKIRAELETSLEDLVGLGNSRKLAKAFASV
jgi:hypothetical protein